MKKVSILLAFLLFSNNLLIAQELVTREYFERMVDYANCRYVQAFIEKNNFGTEYYADTYEKKIKPELENVNFDDSESIISFQELEKLLFNNQPALELSRRINERKLKYGEFQDNKTLINSLATSGWKNVDLSNTAIIIQNEFLYRLVPSSLEENSRSSESEVVKAQTIQTSTQVEDLNQKIETLQLQYEDLKNDLRQFIWIILSIFAILLLIILTFLFCFRKKQFREKIINIVIGSQRIEEKFSQREISKNSNLNERDLNVIVNRVLECKRLSENEFRAQKETNNEDKPVIQKTSFKYLKGKSGKTFSRIENTPENSFFRLVGEKDGVAQFEFFGDESEAIAKRIFSEDICKIVSGGYPNAKHVKTIKLGRVKRVGDQWEVIEPLEINLS